MFITHTTTARAKKSPFSLGHLQITLTHQILQFWVYLLPGQVKGREAIKPLEGSAPENRAAERLGGKNTPQWSSNECHLCHNRCVTFILWEVTAWKSIYSCPVLSNPHSKPAFNKIPSFPCEIIVAKITRKILSHMKNILSSSCK